MAPDPKNPYSPPKAKLAANHERTSATSLALGTVGFLGFVFGTTLTLLAALILGIAVSMPPLNAWLDNGPVPGLLPLALLVSSLPAGIVGGTVCGLCRGKRIFLSLALACSAVVITIFLATHGDLGGSEAIPVVAGALVSVIAGMLICNQLMLQMLKQRCMSLTDRDKFASFRPGLGLVIVTSAILVVALICLTIGFFRPPSTSGGTRIVALGSATLLGIINSLTSLYLTVAYPFRWKTGTLLLVAAVATFCVSVVQLLFFS